MLLLLGDIRNHIQAWVIINLRFGTLRVVGVVGLVKRMRKRRRALGFIKVGIEADQVMLVEGVILG